MTSIIREPSEGPRARAKASSAVVSADVPQYAATAGAGDWNTNTAHTATNRSKNAPRAACQPPQYEKHLNPFTIDPLQDPRQCRHPLACDFEARTPSEVRSQAAVHRRSVEVTDSVWNAVAYALLDEGPKIGSLGVTQTSIFGAEVGVILLASSSTVSFAGRTSRSAHGDRREVPGTCTNRAARYPAQCGTENTAPPEGDGGCPSRAWANHRVLRRCDGASAPGIQTKGR